jgi:uncharacterized protein YjcR
MFCLINKYLSNFRTSVNKHKTHSLLEIKQTHYKIQINKIMNVFFHIINSVFEIERSTYLRSVH